LRGFRSRTTAGAAEGVTVEGDVDVGRLGLIASRARAAVSVRWPAGLARLDRTLSST
jgi:hypothetical protein